MNSMLVLLLLTSVSSKEVQAVHSVEVSHVYNQEGEERFSQVIFWESKRCIACYLMLNNSSKKIIFRHRRNEHYPYHVIIEKDHRRLTIKTKKLKVTHTLHDPEEENRAFRAVNNRNDFLKGW